MRPGWEPIASELQPYRKLKASRGIVLAAVANELPEIGRSRREVRVGREYRSVQRIECFKAELGGHSFADARGFDGGGVVCRGPSIAQVAPTSRKRLKRVRLADLEDRLFVVQIFRHRSV